jgi:hypothetical protein
MTDTANESMTAAELRDQHGPSERELQEALIEWARHQPDERSLLYANVNGQYRPGQAPEPGLTPGVPDLTLPVASDDGGVLYLELKVGRNDLTDAQERMCKRLRSAGNRVEVCRRLDDAIAVIRDHLGDAI